MARALVFDDTAQARRFVRIGMRLLELPKQSVPITPGLHGPPVECNRFMPFIQHPTNGTLAMLWNDRAQALATRWISRLDAADRTRLASAIRDRLTVLDDDWRENSPDGDRVLRRVELDPP